MPLFPGSSETNITIVYLNFLEHAIQAYARISAFLKFNLRGFGYGKNYKLYTMQIHITFAKSIQTASRLPISIIGRIVTRFCFKACLKARHVVEPGSRNITS